MPHLDPDSGSLIIRLAFDGLPGSGKTTILQALQRMLCDMDTCYESPPFPDGSAGFTWMQYRGGAFDDKPVTCRIFTLPETDEANLHRLAMLAMADVVICVMDADMDLEDVGLAYFRRLQQRIRALSETPIEYILLANHQDTLRAVSPAALAAKIDYTVPVMGSAAILYQGIREVFTKASTAAISRAQQRLEAGALLRRREESNTGESFWNLLCALPATPPAAPTSNTVIQVWPPIAGRRLLLELPELSLTHELTDGVIYWLASAENMHWRIMSRREWLFNSEASAAEKLRIQSEKHLMIGHFLSEHRCLVITREGHGIWRLWQITRTSHTLMQTLQNAMKADTPPQKAALLRTGGRRFLEAFAQFAPTIPTQFLTPAMIEDGAVTLYAGLLDAASDAEYSAGAQLADAVSVLRSASGIAAVCDCLRQEMLDSPVTHSLLKGLGQTP